MADMALDELQSGYYNFEAIAVFSLDAENVGDSMIEIPVSLEHSLDNSST